MQLTADEIRNNHLSVHKTALWPPTTSVTEIQYLHEPLAENNLETNNLFEQLFAVYLRILMTTAADYLSLSTGTK